MRNYERLDVLTFGRELVRSKDLDPVYVALNNVEGFMHQQKLRWLVAYIAFYDCGPACYLSEKIGQEFWDAMEVAARNETPAPTGGRWPRGHERRHFRGKQAVLGVLDWRTRHDHPEEMFAEIAGLPKHQLFEEVSERARQYRSIGPWLSFKVVDLVDACLGREISQDNIDNFIYETPRDSLFAIAAANGIFSPTNTVTAALKFVREGLADCEIPHKPGHPLDLFCLETIACKHASHLSGHYPLYNDTTEIRRSLDQWVPTCESAREFLAAMPEAPAAGRENATSAGDGPRR